MKEWVLRQEDLIAKRDGRRFVKAFEGAAKKSGVPDVGGDPQKATIENLRAFVRACGGDVRITVRKGGKWWNL